MTAIDDGDDDLIVTSKPKSGDGLNVFVADLGNASSYYVNAVRKNQKRETERRKDLACYNGAASFEGHDNNNDGQRWEKNIVEHKGFGVMFHDEADNDNTLEYDDQEVEWYHNDVGGGQDLADNEEFAAEGDQEHEDYDEERCAHNDGSAEEWTEEGMTMPSTPGRADMTSGTPRRMSAMTARTTTASTARAAGTMCGQWIRGENAACMPGHLEKKRSIFILLSTMD